MIYNGVAVLPVPKEVIIIGFSDDLAVIVIAKQPQPHGGYNKRGGESAKRRVEFWWPLCRVGIGCQKRVQIT